MEAITAVSSERRRIWRRSITHRVGIQRTGRQCRAEAVQRRLPVRLRAPPHKLHESLLVEVEEEAVVEERGGGVGPEERERGVDVPLLERGAGAADEEARAVGGGRRGRRGGGGGGGGGGGRGRGGGRRRGGRREEEAVGSGEVEHEGVERVPVHRRRRLRRRRRRRRRRWRRRVHRGGVGGNRWGMMNDDGGGSRWEGVYV
jgi:hypothetical protein